MFARDSYQLAFNEPRKRYFRYLSLALTTLSNNLVEALCCYMIQMWAAVSTNFWPPQLGFEPRTSSSIAEHSTNAPPRTRHITMLGIKLVVAMWHHQSHLRFAFSGAVQLKAMSAVATFL